MSTYREFHRRSIAEPDAFWREQATLIDWQTPFTQFFEQQFVPSMHAAPFGRHGSTETHLPMTQLCEQQSAFAMHSVPSG